MATEWPRQPGTQARELPALSSSHGSDFINRRGPATSRRDVFPELVSETTLRALERLFP